MSIPSRPTLELIGWRSRFPLPKSNSPIKPMATAKSCSTPSTNMNREFIWCVWDRSSDRLWRTHSPKLNLSLLPLIKTKKSRHSKSNTIHLQKHFSMLRNARILFTLERTRRIGSFKITSQQVPHHTRAPRDTQHQIEPLIVSRLTPHKSRCRCQHDLSANHRHLLNHQTTVKVRHQVSYWWRKSLQPDASQTFIFFLFFRLYDSRADERFIHFIPTIVSSFHVAIFNFIGIIILDESNYKQRQHFITKSGRSKCFTKSISGLAELRCSIAIGDLSSFDTAKSKLSDSLWSLSSRWIATLCNTSSGPRRSSSTESLLSFVAFANSSNLWKCDKSKWVR